MNTKNIVSGIWLFAALPILTLITTMITLDNTLLVLLGFALFLGWALTTVVALRTVLVAIYERLNTTSK